MISPRLITQASAAFSNRALPSGCGGLTITYGVPGEGGGGQRESVGTLCLIIQHVVCCVPFLAQVLLDGIRYLDGALTPHVCSFTSRLYVYLI